MLTHANTSHESSERLIVASRHTPFLRSTKTHTLLGAAVTRACVRGSDTTYIRMGEVLPASPPSLTRSLSPSVWLGRCVRPFGGESGRSEWNGFPASGPLQWKLLGVKDRLSQSVRKLFSAPSSSRTVFFFSFFFFYLHMYLNVLLSLDLGEFIKKDEDHYTFIYIYIALIFYVQ